MPPTLPADILHYAALDARMVAAVRSVRVLTAMSWPAALQRQFLEDWRRGRAALPRPEYVPEDHRERRAELDAICAEADPQHPLGLYLLRTASSWSIATRLLETLGSDEVTGHSISLFGRPGDALPGGNVSNLDAARHFISVADELDGELLVDEDTGGISASDLQAELSAILGNFFCAHPISVELDPELVSKAAAGPTRIRLRSNAVFTDYDRRQLLEHEAFVHSLTGLNGREQPYFKSLARTSARVTATQEGLATFAELITGSMDIERMKRISLRIVAIDMALQGADFIEVFRFFLAAGQNETESFSSAQRVFRGVPLTGGAAFTKDTVYLHGLLSVHTFFRWCLQHKRLRLTWWLFAGKMSLQDVFTLEPYFDSGILAGPLYLPRWVKRANGLAGNLAFSLFANRIRLDQVMVDDLALGR